MDKNFIRYTMNFTEYSKKKNETMLLVWNIIIVDFVSVC